MTPPRSLVSLWIDHPVPGLHESPTRLTYLLSIYRKVHKSDPEFRLCFEYLVAILLVDKKKIEKKGRLSIERVSPFIVQDRLQFISPFCKHYMFHLDPNNFTEDAWSHAKPRLPHYQHPVNEELFDKEPEEIKAALYYNSCFHTDPELSPVHPSEEQKTLCLERDGRKCVLTGESNTRVFHFIPITWNDTVEHNNATGILKQASVELADVDLVDDPGEICSEHLYDHLVKGLCAFKFMRCTKLGHGKASVKLKFYWMPKLPTRSNFDLGDGANLNSGHSQFRHEVFELFKRIDAYYWHGCPTRFEETFRMGQTIASGHQVDIRMSEEDAEKFESVVKVHWACVLFTALCGAAGRAWDLTGMDLSDGSLQPRVHEFEADEQEQTMDIKESGMIDSNFSLEEYF
ncbi:hypothetical protein NXS19_002746 [Fusarium pseudograminearum]|nr:hypothetical protein NXS19_002746 [Fusarium pseudograminearum]